LQTGFKMDTNRKQQDNFEIAWSRLLT